MGGISMMEEERILKKNIDYLTTSIVSVLKDTTTILRLKKMFEKVDIINKHDFEYLNSFSDEEESLLSTITNKKIIKSLGEVSYGK